MRLLSRGVTTALLALVFTFPATADDWPQFRGPDRSGISPETGLLAAWPEDGPREVFRRELGEGYSAVSVVGDHLYTMHAIGEGEEQKDAALAMNLEGETLWETVVDEKIETEFGNGPRTTPNVVGDVVVVMGSHGKVAVLTAENGEVQWTVDLQEAFGGRLPGWGFASSPLVHDGLVIVEAGGPDGKSYVALDLGTGETRWTSGEAPGPGYNSPLLVEVGGEPRIVVVVQGALKALDVSGAEKWSYEWPRGETWSMPIFVAPDRIYASGAGHVGAQVVRFDEGAETAVEQVWAERMMRNHFSSGVFLDGRIYAFDNATLKCVDVETAETCWAKRGLGKGSLIAADGRLIALSDKGKLVQLALSEDGYEQTGSVQAMEGRSWTAPVLANGTLYLRNHSTMVAYDLRDASADAEAGR